MPDDIAVSLSNVTKTYRLYGSQREQLLEVLGLTRFGLFKGRPSHEFKALDDVTLDVPRGGRLAIIGRNGAGKTTLLKLISGNFAPTSGQVKVNGSVQALMGMGLGFHPEFTGRENIRASLQYNGLVWSEMENATEDIIDFCELGEFIDQPFKTYSLGMQARLMFATATAIKPDILIVDEVLGAGDAYFSVKSSLRMQQLAMGGCTLLLVSHSTQQVLQFCDRAAWLENGKVQLMDAAFSVVKEYERFINNRRTRLVSGNEQPLHGTSDPSDEGAKPTLAEKQFSRVTDVHTSSKVHDSFLPNEFHFLAPGGLSRWETEPGVKISGFAILVEGRLSNVLQPLRDVEFVISLVAEMTMDFSCTYGVVIHDALGNVASRLISPADHFHTEMGCHRTVCIAFRPNRLGPGDYTLGISILEATSLERLNHARRYDLLGRTFEFKVVLPASESAPTCGFFHDATWTFEQAPPGQGTLVSSDAGRAVRGDAV